MGDHRDDLIYSADAATFRALCRQAQSLNLSIQVSRVPATMSTMAIVCEHRHPKPQLLAHKEFPLTASDWNINVWLQQQLIDYSSWK